MNESMDLVAYIFLGIAFVYLEFRMRTKVNDQRNYTFIRRTISRKPEVVSR